MARNTDAASLDALKTNAVRNAERVVTTATLIFSYCEHVQNAEIPWYGSPVNGETLGRLEDALASSYRLPPDIVQYGLSAKDALTNILIRGDKYYRFTRPQLNLITHNTTDPDVIDAEVIEV